MDTLGEHIYPSHYWHSHSFNSQCLIQQQNRRFVVGFLITQTRFRIIIVDRSGALEFPWVNFRGKPETFIKFAWFIAGCDLKKMGFDTSIFYKKVGDSFQRFISVVVGPPASDEDEEIDYANPPSDRVLTFQIEALTYRDRGVRSPGTMSWDAKEVGGDGAVVTIKDYWRHPDRQHEGELLQQAEEAGVMAVVRLIASQYEPEDLKKKISTANARGMPTQYMKAKDGTPFINMVHTRLVTERQVPITEFTDKSQFLEAFADIISGQCDAPVPLILFLSAFTAHRELLEKTNMLHRCINLNSMLLGKHGSPPGKRGLLGDLSMAVTVPRQSEDTLAERDFRAVR